MNILPHKSWHVRTKKNIARVRKDEAKAAEEEKETQRRVALAAQESRTAFLRERANQRVLENGEELPLGMPLADVADIIQKDGHVNFFQELEDGRKQEKVNSEHEAEKKKEQDDYEKKIGYLVYLGQNSGEHSKEKPWYAKVDRNSTADLEEERKKFKCAEGKEPTRSAEVEKSELTAEELKVVKFKDFHDPLKSIRKYMSTPGVKKKLEKSAEKSSLKRKADESIDQDKSTKSSKKAKKEKKKKHKHKKSSKKHKKHKSSRHASKISSEDDSEDSEEERKKRELHILRQERLERERVEKKRAEIHLAKLNGITLPEETTKPKDSSQNRSSVKQRYNSQFNPHLARQNFDN